MQLHVELRPETMIEVKRLHKDGKTNEQRKQTTAFYAAVLDPLRDLSATDRDRDQPERRRGLARRDQAVAERLERVPARAEHPPELGGQEPRESEQSTTRSKSDHHRPKPHAACHGARRGRRRKQTLSQRHDTIARSNSNDDQDVTYHGSASCPPGIGSTRLAGYLQQIRFIGTSRPPRRCTDQPDGTRVSVAQDTRHTTVRGKMVRAGKGSKRKGSPK